MRVNVWKAVGRLDRKAHMNCERRLISHSGTEAIEVQEGDAEDEVFMGGVHGVSDEAWSKGGMVMSLIWWHRLDLARV